ncbi:MAG: LysM peptidoglycan-binding domain-containing protein [Limisphaerales bacterium]
MLALWVGITLGGCLPPGQSQSDEEKEPHYVLGLGRVNAMDYQGAIQAFEESLETNPHSAAAHFQLAMLYENKEPDPAAAIYHYQQYLKFNPNAGNAEIIKQHIASCKQQLAADVLPLPSTPAAQKQINQLIEQNQQLQDEINKWRAYYASQLAAKNQAAPTPGPEVAQASANPVLPQPAQNITTPASPPGGNHPARSAATNATTRTHMVIAGETAIRIARRYGVSLDALLAANPDLEPRRMRVGQVLNIPSP